MDMNTVLEKLVALDHEAARDVADAQNSLLLAKQNTELSAAAFRKEYRQKAEQRIGIVKETEGRASAEASALILQKYKAIADNMEKLFAEKEGEWVERIVDRILER